MTVKPLHFIGVIGAGTMGSGIALAALYAGCEVFVQDAYPEMLENASGYIQKYLEKKGQGESFNKLHLVENLEALKSVEIVIEAAPEKLELKQEIFRHLDAICRAGRHPGFEYQHPVGDSHRRGYPAS